MPAPRRVAAFVLVVTACLPACGPGANPRPPRHGATPGPGTRAVEAIPGPEIGVRQVVYLPIYSHVYITDGGDPYLLSATVTVRNTDASQPIVLNSARYLDSGGRELHAYLGRPLEIGPLASTAFFVAQSDSRGGTGASFLIDWAARSEVSAPIAEAVMIGTTGSQGISFVTRGQPISGRGSAAPE